MSKVKTVYFCQNCGTQYSQWMGQCKNCNQWNTISEEIVEKEFKLGNLTKTRHKQLQENKIPMEDEASWQCKYCPYWKNRETGESTCLNYGVNFEN